MKKPISKKQAKNMKRLADLNRKRFLEKMEPYAEEIRRLYLEEYLGPQDIERALNKKVSYTQILKFLENTGVYQGKGTSHHSIIKRKARLKDVDPNKELFKAYQAERKMADKAWAKVSWSKHREFKVWNYKRYYYEKYSKDPDYKLRESKQGKLTYMRNKDKKLQQVRQWQEEHPERFAEHKRRENKKLKEQRSLPAYRVIVSLRNRINKTTGITIYHTTYGVGCSAKKLQGHLESQFAEGMTWDNYGSYWDVGLVKPSTGFQLKDRKEILKCFNWKNLKPEIIPDTPPVDPFAFFRK